MNQFFSGAILLPSKTGVSGDGTVAPCKKRRHSGADDDGSQQENKCPELSSMTRRNLFDLKSSQSAACLDRSKSFDVSATKSVVTSTNENDVREATPLRQAKRRKGSLVETASRIEESSITTPMRRLVRSNSEAIIKSALIRSDEQQNLIGDFSRPYCLPLVRSKHQDLKAISPQTVRPCVCLPHSKQVA